MSDADSFWDYDAVLDLCTRDCFNEANDQAELSSYAITEQQQHDYDYYTLQEILFNDLQRMDSSAGLCDYDIFVESIGKDVELLIDGQCVIYGNRAAAKQMQPAAATPAELPAATNSGLAINSDPVFTCLQLEVHQPHVLNEQPRPMQTLPSFSDLVASLSLLFSIDEPLPAVELTECKPTIQNSQDSNNAAAPAAMPAETAAEQHKSRTADAVGQQKQTFSASVDLNSQYKVLLEQLGLPFDYPLEFVNNGYGIVNPMYIRKPRHRAQDTENTKDLHCPLCHKEFTILGGLNRHIARHSTNKRYMCVYCIKSFHDLFDLKRHTRTHTGVRPYKCDMCWKMFTQLNSLEQHKRLLHGIYHRHNYMERRRKQFICEQCGEQSFNSKAHNLHLLRKHPPSCV